MQLTVVASRRLNHSARAAVKQVRCPSSPYVQLWLKTTPVSAVEQERACCPARLRGGRWRRRRKARRCGRAPSRWRRRASVGGRAGGPRAAGRGRARPLAAAAGGHLALAALRRLDRTQRGRALLGLLDAAQ